MRLLLNTVRCISSMSALSLLPCHAATAHGSADASVVAFQGRAATMAAWADALSNAMATLNKLGVAKAVKDSVNSQLPRAHKLLTLTGMQGVLFEADFKMTKTPPVAHKELLGSTVSLIGVGSSPKGVIAWDMGKNRLRPGGISQNDQMWERDVADDFYLWFQKSVHGYSVAYIDAEPTRRAARRLFLNKTLRAQLNRESREQSIDRIAKTIFHKINSKARRAELKTMLENRDAALKRYKRINDKLQRDLAKANQANQDAQFFSTMALTFGLANAVTQVHQDLGAEAPKKLATVKSANQVKQILLEYSRKKGNEVQHLRMKLNEIYNLNKKQEKNFIDLFRKEKVPLYQISGF